MIGDFVEIALHILFNVSIQRTVCFPNYNIMCAHTVTGSLNTLKTYGQKINYAADDGSVKVNKL